MREVDIVYLYEHAARELDVACSVSALLEEKFGLSVEIVQWPVGFARTVHRLKPGKLVILPFLYSKSDYDPLTSYWRDVHYVNLTWEQLFYPGNEIAKMLRGDFAIKHVFHHVWSDKYADNLRKLGVPDENIFLNGQPAYMLYDEPYRRYFSSKESLAKAYKLDPAKKWIFFPENYNWAFYDKKRLDAFVRDGQTLEQVMEMKTYCELSLGKVLDWFERILQSDINVEIILRPRPSVTDIEFKRILRHFSGEIHARLKIIQDGSVREWILASDVILSSHSTSLIEAAVAGKSPFILEPIPMPSTLYVPWHDNLSHLRSFQDFFEVCSFEGKGAHDHGMRLSSWAHGTLMKSGDSIINLAVYLNKLAMMPRREIEVPDLLTGTSRLPPWLWALYRNVRRAYFYWRTGAVEPVYVKDMLTSREIKDRIKRWSTVLSSDN